MGRRGINSLICLRRSLSLARVERFASVVLVAVAAVLLSVSLVGCSQPPLFERSIQAMRSVQSFDFVERGDRGDGPPRGDDVLTIGGFLVTTVAASGTYQSPDRLSKSARVGSFAREVSTTVRSISVGNSRYLTNPVSEDFVPYHEGLERHAKRGIIDLFANPLDSLEEAISQVGRYRSKGVEDLGGVKVRHLTWETSWQTRRVDTTREIDFFIGVEDSLFRKLEIYERWTEIPCNPEEVCTSDLILPGWTKYTLEFSFPGDQTPIVAPTE